MVAVQVPYSGAPMRYKTGVECSPRREIFVAPVVFERVIPDLRKTRADAFREVLQSDTTGLAQRNADDPMNGADPMRPGRRQASTE
jgi:hypothetical protein